MQNLKISQKLFGGFFIVLAVLALAVGKSIRGVKGLKDNTDRIVNLRMPTAQASQQMMNNIINALLGVFARQDEIGQEAHAVQAFKDNMIKACELESEQAAAHAAELKRAQTIDNRTGTS